MISSNDPISTHGPNAKANPRNVPLGQIVATPNALVSVHPREITVALGRHQSGDWGEVCDEDRAANDRALIEGTRLLSVYRTKSGTKFWIITEADRSVTTILMPDDY